MVTLKPAEPTGGDHYLVLINYFDSVVFSFFLPLTPTVKDLKGGECEGWIPPDLRGAALLAHATIVQAVQLAIGHAVPSCPLVPST